MLALGETGGVSDLDHLDVGLRTYDPTPDAVAEGSTSTLVSSLRYPVFEDKQTTLLDASLAPFSVAESRTSFRFAASGGAQALLSFFRTVTGHRLDLTPYADGSGPSKTPARLVLATRPSALPPSPDDLYTIVPKGDFALAVVVDREGVADDQGGTVAGAVPAIVLTSPNGRLMCGLSGIEYVGLGSGANALSFFTGSPAYADGFDPSAIAQAPTKLTADATTAWGLPGVLARESASSAAPLTYYAQPDGAVLFQPSSGPGTTFQPLVYLEVASNTLPSAVAATTAIPLFPYGGVSAGDPDLGAYRTLETKVLSPARRARIAQAGGVPFSATLHPQFIRAESADSRFFGVTPQGLLAIFADTSLQTIDELVLAQMQGSSRFSLHGLPNGAPLRTAIASNQLFLVASNPTSFVSHLEDATNRIVIEAWTFDLDPSRWATTGPPGLQGTTLIFKFAAGRLVDLIKNTGTWAKAGNGAGASPFNLDDQATSIRVGTLIEQAIDAYNGGAGDTDFATFVSAVTDPSWQGILILNAATPLTRLPAACNGLAAGIDPALFHAHHVGINLAKINATTPISIEPSSMFALIRYQSPAPRSLPTVAIAYEATIDLGFLTITELSLAWAKGAGGPSSTKNRGTRTFLGRGIRDGYVESETHVGPGQREPAGRAGRGQKELRPSLRGDRPARLVRSLVAAGKC